MNTKALLTIKTEKSLKDLAQKTAEEIGIPLGTIINALIKQFVRDKEVTLSIRNKPNAHLKSLIREAEAELANGKTSAAHKSVVSLMKDLDA